MSMTKGKVRWWEEGTNPPGRFNFHRVASDQAPGVRPAPSQILSLSLSLSSSVSFNLAQALARPPPNYCLTHTHALTCVHLSNPERRNNGINKIMT